MSATTTVETKPENGAQSAPAAAIVRPPVTTDNEDTSRALNAFASAANFATAQRIAIGLSQSTLVPKEYQGNVPNCVIAMEIASRIGASVFMVMQHLDIIHGRPSWRATFLIATVNASQRFTPIRFRWEGKPGTDQWGCRAVAKDRDSGEECVGTLITIAIAKAEGWSTKSGSKWLTIPEQMLMYRAASFWTRVYSPELSLGMQTTEESVDALPELQLAPMPNATQPAGSLEDRLRAVPEPAKPESAQRDFAAEADKIREAIVAAVESKDTRQIKGVRALFEAQSKGWPDALTVEVNKYYVLVSGEAQKPAETKPVAGKSAYLPPSQRGDSYDGPEEPFT